MANTDKLIRYNLIIKILRRKASNFKEIENYLSLESDLQDLDLNISKRTFQRDLKAIYLLYNIAIQFDFSKQVYFIDFDNQPELNKRLLEAFDMFNALSISERLSQNIQFEQRKAQGTAYLHDFLEAIKRKHIVKFKHQKFWESEITNRKVKPLALKEFRSRWYVIAEDTKDATIKSFGLDRIHDPEITPDTFDPPYNFDINEFYKHSFGIIGPNGQEPEDIVISFNSDQGKYIKTLPLHNSQEIISETEHELVIRLKLIITFDFVMELLSMARNLKVIQPQSLTEEIKLKAQQILAQYN